MPKEKLSQQFVNLIYCAENKIKEVYYDTTVTCFILEVRSSGGKTYAVRYRDAHGRQRQYKIGNAADISFEKAKREAQKIRARVTVGENPSENRQTKKVVPTAHELAERYLAHLRTYKSSAFIDDCTLRKHILPRFGKMRLDEVKQADVVAWLSSKVKIDGYAVATVNRFHITLGYMYKLAKRWGLPGSEVNPLAGVCLPNPNNARERYLSAQEAQRLQSALELSSNPQLKNIVALLLLTGCRKSELLHARWDQFDLEKRMWRVPMSKSGKARFVPLSSKAIEVIRGLERRPDCPFILPNPRTGKPFTNLYADWQAVRERAGMPELRLHDLRHSAASNMVNSGQSLYVVGQVLGHTQPKTTQRYAHLAPDTLLAAVDAAESVLGVSWTRSRA